MKFFYFSGADVLADFSPVIDINLRSTALKDSPRLGDLQTDLADVDLNASI